MLKEESTKNMTVLMSLNQAMHELMDSNPGVLVLGEDLLDPYGGAFKVTKGLSSRFPDRVFTTPISEAAIVGVANGLALRTLRPIVEIMFGDFLTLAADQLINHAAKFRAMYNDAVRVPLVVRTPMGGRRGYGPTHSQCLEKHFLGVPGLWVLAPHILGNPGDLLKQAVLECDDPVIFIENKTCYGRFLKKEVQGLVSETFSDAGNPFPSTYWRHQSESGSVADGLILCYGGMTPHCLETVQALRDQEGLFLDLAVMTQLSPSPISHIQWILKELRPKACIFVEEASISGGWSSEMFSRFEESAQQTPDYPPIRYLRIGGLDSIVASSRELEAKTLPQTADIVQKILNFF